MEMPYFIAMLGYRVGYVEYQLMHLTILLFFVMVTLFWLVQGSRTALGMTKLPRLRDFPSARDEDCPRISILFAARDEEEKLPMAVETLRKIDYPHLEVVAVDDRSTDGTSKILQEAARRDPRLKVLRIERLPVGWLGKPHALQQGFEATSGEWLLFTDADVQFHREALRRAVSVLKAQNLDHLTLICQAEMRGFWEKAVLTFFGLGLHIATNPHGVSDPRSSAYIGIGAFQLVRRSSYVVSGMHKRLAMEVVDDMKLGKIIKQAGFRSTLGIAPDFVSVRWHAGIRNIIRGVTKNFFAVAGFRWPLVVAQVAGVCGAHLIPFVALPFLHGWTLALAGASVLIAVAMHGGTAYVMQVSPLYALTHPLGAAIFCYMLLRSTAVTLKQGGIYWRGTFYPLDELRRGLV